MANGKQKKVSEIISSAEIDNWNCKNLIIIKAGTGVGKSYFIKNVLYEYAKKNNEKILMLIHRKLCVEQFNMEILADGKSDVIEIVTYQKIEADEMYKCDIDISKYKYIVCDEFHYFISDASFNHTTDISFKKILSAKNSVKIFMSATGEDVEDYISCITDLKLTKYNLPLDFSFIGTLNFYHNDASLYEFAKALIENGEKGIFFIQQAKKAYALYKEFKNHALFNCSKSNNDYFKFVDEDKVNRMLKEQKFNEQFLITTSCLDAGVNIIDTELRNIFIDIKDIGSLIQCMGRKRMQPEEEPFNLYIKVINNQQLGGLESNAKRQLEMADYLKTHTTDEWIVKYPRQIDRTQIIYDENIDDGNNNTCTKKINELMYRKKYVDIDNIHRMIKYGDYGYCKYLARKFGKYDPDIEYYDYTVINANLGLEKYLSDHVGQVMLQSKDRKELIKTMDVRVNGKLKKSIDILNAALKEDNLPYKIEKFETSRVINGKKKNYKSAWKIISYDWNSQ